MVGDVDDAHDLGDRGADHALYSVAQCCRRGRAALAATRHAQPQLSVNDVHHVDAPAMGGDRGIGRTVEHGLYGLAQFGIGAPPDWRPRAVGAERRIMRKRGTDRCRERGLEPIPRDFGRPRHGHDAIGDLHGAHAANGEERGGERRVLCGGGVGEV